MEIYLVLYSWGEYSDREVRADQAFTSLEKAREYVKQKTEETNVELAKYRKLHPRPVKYPWAEFEYWIETIELAAD